MADGTILVVEDDDDILELISYHLRHEGYQVRGMLTGEEALARASSVLPDLILLDRMLPALDGLVVCDTLKTDAATRNTPIIMLSARGEPEDVVAGLEAGADDYIVKPFKPRDLLTTIARLLSRTTETTGDQEEVYTLMNLHIDSILRSVRVADHPIELTDDEFALCHCLARHPGKIFTRHQLASILKVPADTPTETAVDTTVDSLRCKLGDDGEYLKTVPDVGHYFADSQS